MVKNLTKTFHPGNVNEVKAICGIDIELGKGEFVTLIGPNGSGKSTLLHLLSGTLMPDKGTILFDEVNVTHLVAHRRAKYVGRVFQNIEHSTVGELTIEENLCVALLKGKRRRFLPAVTSYRRKVIKEQLSQLGMGLEDRMTTKVKFLSGGQRQAISLLMACLEKPKLLLLDEHTAALDPEASKNLLILTNQIVRGNELTTLMVTHNLEDALAYGDRSIMLNRGKVAFELSYEEKKRKSVTDLIGDFRQVKDFVMGEKMLL